MKKSAIVFIFCAFLSIVVSVASTTASGDLEAVVIRIIDGDTIEVTIDGKPEKIRIIGLDTPELHHPKKPVEYFAKEAKKKAEKMLSGKTIKLRFDQANEATSHRGRYKRLLAHVLMPDGTLFAERMILEGYAHAYTKYPFSPVLMDRYRQAEKTAKETGQGLWNEETPPANAGQGINEAIVGKWVLHWSLYKGVFEEHLNLMSDGTVTLILISSSLGIPGKKVRDYKGTWRVEGQTIIADLNLKKHTGEIPARWLEGLKHQMEAWIWNGYNLCKKNNTKKCFVRNVQ